MNLTYKLKKLLPYARMILGVAAIGYITRYVYQSWRTAGETVAVISPWQLGAAVTLFISAQMLAASTWRFILSDSRKTLRFCDALKMRSYAMILRFIPGKIWHIAGRVDLAQQGGYSKTAAVSGIVEENAGSILAASLYGLVFIPVFFIRIAVIVAVVGIAATMRYLQRAGKAPGIRVKRFPVIVLLYGVYWLIMGTGFYCCTSALAPVSPAQTPLFIGSASIGWAAGVVSFIFPNGIGVREGVAAGLLKTHIPFQTAMTAAVLFRLTETGAEMLIVCGLFLSRFFRAARTAPGKAMSKKV